MAGNIFGGKKFGGKKIWREKIWREEILMGKIFGGKKFWRETFLAGKNFGGKKIWQEKIWREKILAGKKLRQIFYLNDIIDDRDDGKATKLWLIVWSLFETVFQHFFTAVIKKVPGAYTLKLFMAIIYGFS